MPENPPLPTAVAVDLDSTLASTLHRAHMINKFDREATDWLAYAQACAEDPPTATVDLLRLLAPHHTVFLITSRPIGAEEQTRAWLAKHEIPFDYLVMQKQPGRSAVFKVSSLRMIRQRYKVVLMLEDQWGIGEAVTEELGIPTVIVRSYPPDGRVMNF